MINMRLTNGASDELEILHTGESHLDLLIPTSRMIGGASGGPLMDVHTVRLHEICIGSCAICMRA